MGKCKNKIGFDQMDVQSVHYLIALEGFHNDNPHRTTDGYVPMPLFEVKRRKLIVVATP